MNDASDLNLALAVVIALLSAYIGADHLRERGWHAAGAILGGAFLAFSMLSLVTTLAPALHVPLDEREPFRFAAAFLRGAIAVLLGGYALFRWRR